MGAGKTTVGKALAGKLGSSYTDRHTVTADGSYNASPVYARACHIRVRTDHGTLEEVMDEIK